MMEDHQILNNNYQIWINIIVIQAYMTLLSMVFLYTIPILVKTLKIKDTLCVKSKKNSKTLNIISNLQCEYSGLIMSD